MAPGSLSTWIQRSGRAGRSGSSAISVLLVEPSVFQLRKAKEQKTNEKKRSQNKSVTVKQEVEDEVDSEYEGFHHDDQVQDEDSPSKNASQLHDVDLGYRKKLEGGLRNWINPQDCNCRREVSNAYFGNPPSPTGACSQAWFSPLNIFFSYFKRTISSFTNWRYSPSWK